MDNMREIDEIKAKIDEAVKDIKSSATLREIKMKFLGKSGEISSLMKNSGRYRPKSAPQWARL